MSIGNGTGVTTATRPGRQAARMVHEEIFVALVRFFVKLRSVHPFSGWMFVMSTETESSLATRPSLLARLKDWSQQTAWREFDHDYAPLLRNVARKAGLTDAEAGGVGEGK